MQQGASLPQPGHRRPVSSYPDPGLSDLGRGHRRGRFRIAVKAPSPDCAHRLNLSRTAALVNRLAIEKLEQKAGELRADWAWAKAVLDPDYGFLSQYRRIEPQPAEYPPEIAAELDRIEARLEELGELPDEELSDDLKMEAARLEERRDEI